MALDQVGERCAVFACDLHHRAQLFVEQAAEWIVAPGIEGDVQPQARREGHFAQRGKGTAVAAVVVGQQQAGLARIADQLEEATQALRVVQIRGSAGERRQVTVVGMHLGQDGTAQPLLAGAKADQPQLAFHVAVEQRGQLLAHIGDRCERRDHQ